MSDMIFWIGDSDLRFLGMVAAITARSEARRKGPIVRGASGFPQSDAHAIEQLLSGVQIGRDIPLDDLPELKIGIETLDTDALRGILRAARRIEFMEMGMSEDEVDRVMRKLDEGPNGGMPPSEEDQ